MDTHLLEDIGLTKSEAATYLALLELGSTSTGKIVDKANVTSSKIYEILDRLMDKGLVSYVIKQGIKYFEAADPDRLLAYMDEKEKKIDEQKAQVKKLLPELELKQTFAKYKNEATVYKGQKGLETVFYSALSELKKGDFVGAMNIPKRSKAVNRFFLRFVADAEKKGIATKWIFNENAREQAEGTKGNLCQIKIMPETTPAAINIMGNHVIIFPSEAKEIMLIDIENKDVADSFRIQFDNLWNQKVKTYEGKKEIQQLFAEMLEWGDYYAFAEGEKIVKVLGEEHFVWFQKEKERRGIHSKVIMGEKFKKKTSVTKAFAEFKFLPEYENPGATLVFKDKVANVILTDEPVAFLIESEEVAENYRTYFDLLWNQDTQVMKGFDAFERELDIALENFPNKTFDVLGAGMGIKKEEKTYAAFFKKFHKKRQKKGLPTRMLFHHGAKDFIEKYRPEIYEKSAKIKFLPYEMESPVAIFPLEDYSLMVLQEKEPTVIRINNKTVTESFQKQFDELWGREAYTLQGVDAVQEVFEEMLETGHVDFIGAHGYFVDARPTFIDDWEKRAKKKGFTLRNIVEPSFKKHRITEFSFAKTKWTLPEGYSKLSVFWIFGGKVVISNWAEKEPLLFVIENKQLVNVYKEQFETLWKQ